MSVNSQQITIGRGVGALVYSPDRVRMPPVKDNCVYMGADLAYDSVKIIRATERLRVPAAIRHRVWVAMWIMSIFR